MKSSRPSAIERATRPPRRRNHEDQCRERDGREGPGDPRTGVGELTIESTAIDTTIRIPAASAHRPSTERTRIAARRPRPAS